jgi:hypothetical protein
MEGVHGLAAAAAAGTGRRSSHRSRKLNAMLVVDPLLVVC